MEKELFVCVHLWLRVDFAPSLSKGSIPGWPRDASLCAALLHLFPTHSSPASLGQIVPSSGLTASDKCAFYAVEYSVKHFMSSKNQASEEHVPTRYLKIFAPMNQYWPEEYTAPYFSTCGYIKIIWTEDIRNHLRLDKKERCLRLFHLANFMSRFQAANEMFPASLFPETLETLALLMPEETSSTKREKAKAWLEKMKRNRERKAPYLPRMIMVY